MKAKPKTFITYTVQTFNGDAEVWVLSVKPFNSEKLTAVWCVWQRSAA